MCEQQVFIFWSLFLTFLKFAITNCSAVNIHKMVSEMYRVLAFDGFYISISLHSEDDIIDYFMEEEFDWHVSTYQIRNPRWDSGRGVKRSTAHTLIICHKTKPGEKSILTKISLRGVLSDAEALALQEKAAEVHQ